MTSIKTTVIAILFLATLPGLAQQKAYFGKLTSQELSAIKNGTVIHTYHAKDLKNTDITITKSGPGPDIATYGIEGILLGKPNEVADYCDISIEFSNPILSLSFLLSHINNQLAGTEEIQNFSIYAHDNTNITDQATFTWITGPESGYIHSKTGKALFNNATRTVYGVEGCCCESGSGRITISSVQPFYKVTFRHADIGKATQANGVVLAGDFIFGMPVPPSITFNDSVYTDHGKPVTYAVTANDFDSLGTINPASVDLDPLQEGIQDNKTTNEGTFWVDRMGKVTFEPNEDFSGIAKVNYTVRNSYNVTSTVGTFTILVGLPSTVIYFDMDKSVIRTDASQKLDHLINLFKKNPEVRFQLNSYSDCRGKSTYNEVLSEKRAEASAQYLITRGIPAEKILRKGNGESNTQACACDVKENACPEKSYQSSRRTEIKILADRILKQ